MHKLLKFFAANWLIIAMILLFFAFKNIQVLNIFLTFLGLSLGAVVVSCLLSWMNNISEELETIRKATLIIAGIKDEDDNTIRTTYQGKAGDDPENNVYV